LIGEGLVATLARGDCEASNTKAYHFEALPAELPIPKQQQK